MPTALVTTKRKVNEILESISNASSLSPTNGTYIYNASTTSLDMGSVTTINSERPNKRARLTRPMSSFVPPSTHIKINPSTPQLVQSSSQQPTLKMSSTPPQPPIPPSWVPWDRDKFRERLYTFRSVEQWTEKPEIIDEVQWARRGWTCTGCNTVGCVTCAKEVVIDIGPSREGRHIGEENASDEERDNDEETDWQDRAQEELAEVYAEMIIGAHDAGCLWTKRGCDDNIQRLLHLIHQADAFDGLCKRYYPLLNEPMVNELHSNIYAPESLDISKIQQDAIDALHPQSAHASPDSKPFNMTAFLLALFGWQEAFTGIVICTTCWRRLGLWLSKATGNPGSDPAINHLQLAGDHRHYCPWANAVSQNGTEESFTPFHRPSSLDSLAGWQLVLRAVQAKALPVRQERERMEAEASAKLLGDAVGGEESREEQEEKDKERWASVKRLKQAFSLKKGKGKDAGT